MQISFRNCVRRDAPAPITKLPSVQGRRVPDKTLILMLIAPLGNKDDGYEVCKKNKRRKIAEERILNSYQTGRARAWKFEIAIRKKWEERERDR